MSMCAPLFLFFILFLFLLTCWVVTMLAPVCVFAWGDAGLQMKGVQAGLGEVAPEAREAQQAAGELRAVVKVRPALLRLQLLRR